MRRHFSITIAIVLALGVLAGLSALGNLELDRPAESEADPRRTSYNSGPTGTRAFYQLLAESGAPVGRWRESFELLEDKAKDAILVIVGPFPFEQSSALEETAALKKWLAGGGQALIVSRSPRAQFNDPTLTAAPPADSPPWNAAPDELVNDRSDELIVQPTALTKKLRGLALSGLAARLKLAPAPTAEESAAPANNENAAEQEPDTAEEASELSEEEINKAVEQAAAEGFDEPLGAPVIHLGDEAGAVLADFNFGAGRVLFLTDPFVIANNGVGRGANLALALNLLRALGSPQRRVLFDEYHHGYRDRSNPLVAYFRGTPAVWLLGQLLLLSLVLVYSYGKRFARPLPLPQVDRHSPLEFVGSMANLQQAAQARDLALENIYPRFKARLCRALGVSVRAAPAEIAAQIPRRRWQLSAEEVQQTLAESERALAGEQIDDQRLVELVMAMRRIAGQLK